MCFISNYCLSSINPNIYYNLFLCVYKRLAACQSFSCSEDILMKCWWEHMNIFFFFLQDYLFPSWKEEFYILLSNICGFEENVLHCEFSCLKSLKVSVEIYCCTCIHPTITICFADLVLHYVRYVSTLLLLTQTHQYLNKPSTAPHHVIGVNAATSVHIIQQLVARLQ